MYTVVSVKYSHIKLLPMFTYILEVNLKLFTTTSISSRKSVDLSHFRNITGHYNFTCRWQIGQSKFVLVIFSAWPFDWPATWPSFCPAFTYHDQLLVVKQIKCFCEDAPLPRQIPPVISRVISQEIIHPGTSVTGPPSDPQELMTQRCQQVIMRNWFLMCETFFVDCADSVFYQRDACYLFERH